jgi:hypothetical protein
MRRARGEEEETDSSADYADDAERGSITNNGRRKRDSTDFFR